MRRPGVFHLKDDFSILRRDKYPRQILRQIFRRFSLARLLTLLELSNRFLIMLYSNGSD
jgi:hypothetical protein